MIMFAGPSIPFDSPGAESKYSRANEKRLSKHSRAHTKEN